MIPEADFILVALPGFAVERVLRAIQPHLKKGSIIYLLPGQGGVDLVAKAVLFYELHNQRTTVAGVLPLPLRCRISDWGRRVELESLRSSYDVAAVPAANATMAARSFAELLGLPADAVKPIGNYVGLSLHCSNANLHPGRLYGLFGPASQLGQYQRGHVYRKPLGGSTIPHFYETWDDKSSMWVHAISKERKNVWKAICGSMEHKNLIQPRDPRDPSSKAKCDQVPQVKEYLQAIYKGEIADSTTLTDCFLSNDAFKGFSGPSGTRESPSPEASFTGFVCPMKEEEGGGGGFEPDFTHHYFVEDLVTGLAAYKGIAELAEDEGLDEVDTPVIDGILSFFQECMGKEYVVQKVFNRETKQWMDLVEARKQLAEAKTRDPTLEAPSWIRYPKWRLCGRDLRETRAPQAFGISDLEELLKDHLSDAAGANAALGL